MLEIVPDFKNFIGVFAGPLASSGASRFQVVQAFFELMGDKLGIFRVGDNVRGDKYHQLCFFMVRCLGAKQFSYIGKVFQYRNTRRGVCFVCTHQSTHNQNLIVFKNHFGINLPGVKGRLVSHIGATAGNFLADLQVDKVIGVDFWRDIKFDSHATEFYGAGDNRTAS